ncbi:hypothetical protein P4S93_03985 [Aneurinibacillus thermoaerophilus]|uniref:Uncharacterized protein n=1 Tax=Aneurinibacillus thermoaerophilus TaxID=143495 RepID=A0A1G7WXK6_ANETH|nr:MULTISPECIES: hypothetical protein [Aneurinibacillus]AMA73898.1 hypothetical protein ACH33_14330 [Aneurinibacillus sp. XH2]MED0674081.1 hypothetical protein [Aneurinibacillus thermoaerophilus]MED0678068.1 hypothetical protein [Aneurinibacillus thermoaerophilus]MED0755730.1 hypothetical protein [Aneurinibacillus thermoaerophilus]MED0759941.1 hypothetical protein [Aneurinibacillus thermoaerophilus]
MNKEQIRGFLDKARHAIFLGEELKEGTKPKTQEEYLELYETRVERDPLRETALLKEAITPLLSLYKEKWRYDNRAAELMTGNSLPEPEDEEGWLLEVYDEIMNTDTEEEWEYFVARFTS